MPMDVIKCPLGSITVRVSTVDVVRTMCGASDALRSVCVEPVSAHKEGGEDNEIG